MSEKSTVIVDPKKPVILITRWFDAPARLMFEAYSKPELVRRWWGPREQAMIVCEIDFRVGGGWRFVTRGLDGRDHAFHGTYREIVPFTRLVETFVYEPHPDAEAVQSSTFEEIGGRTRLTIEMVHATMASRDGMVQAGMERGLDETHDRLAELLATCTSDSYRATAAGR